MIVKALTRSGTKNGNEIPGLIRYVLRYVINPEKQKGSPLIVTKNLRSRDLKGYIKEFKQADANRISKSSRRVSLHHYIVSMHPDDTPYLNDKKLKEMAKHFFKLRGEGGLYLAAKHMDIHQHLHIIVSGTKLDGKANTFGKPQLAHLKNELTRFQLDRFPELINSLPDHGQKSVRMAQKNIQKDIESKIKEDQKRKDERELKQMQSLRQRSKELEKEKGRGHVIEHRNEAVIVPTFEMST